MHPLSRLGVALAVLVSFASTACAVTLPPPPAPSQEDVRADVALLPATPGKGRVRIETTNGPARVDEIVAHESGVVYGRRGTYPLETDVVKPICTVTPCAASFDYGPHDLRFTSVTDESTAGSARIQATTTDSALVETMGHDDSGGVAHGLGIGFLTLGGLTLVPSGLLTAIGATRSGDDNGPGPRMTTVGEVGLSIGAGLVVLGAVLALVDRPTVQDGSATQVPLAR